MEEEVYVVAVSNNKELSEFTYKLPSPLYLNPNFQWEVSVVDFFHPPIRGSKTDSDIVRFPGVNGSITTVYEFAELISKSVAHPIIYTKSHFKDFYEINNLENFGTNKLIQKHKVNTPIIAEPNVFSVRGWGIHVSIHDSTTTGLFDFPYPDFFFFESGKQYTLPQILYLILKQSLDHINKKKLTEYKNTVQLKLHLLNIVRTFLLILSQEQDKFYGTFQGEQYFLFVHGDFVPLQNFNNKLCQILHGTSLLSMRHPFHTSKSLTYVPVVKNYIEKMDFKITDENGNLIVFFEEKNNICIRLHIRKKL